MRKFLISATLLASAVAIAAPAAAQVRVTVGTQYGNGYGYGYGNQYGGQYGNQYGYGYQNNHSQVRHFQTRVTQLHHRIHSFENRLSRGEFLRLNQQVDALKYRLRQSSYRGIDQWEARDLNLQIAQLERSIYRFARDGRGYGHHGNQYGSNQYGYDRDRDGLDDRYERDGGRDYDEDHDND